MKPRTETDTDLRLSRNLRVSRIPRGEMFEGHLILSMEGETTIVFTAAQEQLIRKALLAGKAGA